MGDAEFGPADLVPGAAVAVVLPTVLALVDADVRSEVVTALVDWSDESLDDLLGRWASSGLGALPAFAVVDLLPVGARVVVRGAISVTVTNGSSTEIVDGEGSPTWIDRLVEGDDYAIAMHGVPVESAGYRVPPGVLPAGAISASVAGRVEAPDQQEQEQEQEQEQALAAGAGAPGEADKDQPEAPVPDEPDAGFGRTLADPYIEMFVEPDGDEPDADVQVAGRPTAGKVPPPVPPSGGSTSLIDAVPGLGASPANDYDQLFGATQFRRVEDAAVRAEPEHAESEHAAAPVGAVSPFAAESSAADRDGHTMSWSQVQAMQGRSSPAPAAAPAPVDPAGTPMVHAVRCVAGHLNPTHASNCRACAAPITDQPHVTVPRPVLGRFVFNTGAVIEVARPMLIGRAPRLGNVVSGQPPELITVPSPGREVSGTHVETRLEGWQVLIVDRNSTNGTVIRMPGRPPQRLRSGEPFPITLGTTVVMADEVEFLYEAAE